MALQGCDYAVVTGGNRGLGKEVAKLLAAEGHPLIITARDLAQAQAVAQELGGKTHGLALDTTSDESFHAFVNSLAQILLPGGKIDLLVNNAGYLSATWDEDSFRKTLATNVGGPMQTIDAVLPYLADGAKVICVSSGLGQLSNLVDDDYKQKVITAKSLQQLLALPYREDSPQKDTMYKSYCISKAALNRAVTIKLQEKDVQAKHLSIVAVSPGHCRTDMGGLMGKAAPRSAEEGGASILWPYKHFTPQLNGAFLDDQGRPYPDSAVFTAEH